MLRAIFMRRICILLTIATLLATMVGCSGNGPVEYDLTIASTSGGSVTEPGEGTFTYDSGEMVNLVAEAEEDYYFVEWTGDVGTVADPNDATTTITMNSDYSITANFASAIEIYDWYDLDAVRDNLGGNYTLMSDLDCTDPGYEELASSTADGGKGWQPIGGSYPTDAFVGSFDGQSYEIRDLFISRPDEMCVGLFGSVGETGVVENLGVVNSSANGGINVGGLAGANLGTVSNSYATGNMTASLTCCVGGLIGYTAGIVNNSYSTGTVTGDNCVGGLVGYNGGTDFAATVNGSYSTGTVTGSEYVGGLVGFNTEGCTVSNSYSTGNVTGQDEVGGLVGYNHDGTVTDSFWDTETSGQATSDGGTGKTTAEMRDITTFSDASWDIVAVVDPDTRNLSYIWNIVDDETYPFLSWEPVS
jgi:hypothetical protein